MTDSQKPMVFEIPDVNMAMLAERLEKLNRRAVKLGVAALESRVHAMREVWVRRETLDEEGRPTHVGPKFRRRFYTVELVGASPKLPGGWTFLGTLQHTEAGNIMRAVPGEEFPEMYRTRPAHCDHCQKQRRRNDTYLVRSEAGEVKQIGHQCVRDFLGHVTPEMLGWLATLLKELNDCSDDGEGGGGSWGREVTYTVDWVTACAGFTLERGFVPKAAAQAGSNVEPTATTAMRYCRPSKDEVNEDRVPKIENLEAAKELAAAAMEWAKNLDAKSDYEHNLKIASQLEAVGRREEGLLASLPAAYRRHALRIEQERKARADRPVSEHVGTVGQRDVFTLTLGRVMVMEGFHAQNSYLYMFNDAAGNSVKWFATRKQDMEEGKTYRVKGTVKKHDVYKEQKQTMITRCSVEGEMKEAA